jgi:hypothetical protein
MTMKQLTQMKLVINRYSLLLLILVNNTLFYAQKSESAYLIFNNDSLSKCYRSHNERDENGKMIIKYSIKDSRANGSFIICNNKFKIKPNSRIIEVKKNKLSKIISIESFEKIITENWNKENMDINKHFKKIYVLEFISEDKYLGYEVYYDYNYFPDIN